MTVGFFDIMQLQGLWLSLPTLPAIIPYKTFKTQGRTTLFRTQGSITLFRTSGK